MTSTLTSSASLMGTSDPATHASGLGFDDPVPGLIRWARSLLLASGLDYAPGEFLSRMIICGVGIGFGMGLIFINLSPILAYLIGTGIFLVFEAFVFGTLLITADNRTRLIDDALPDFLSVMASNIKSGLTYDRALLLSARKEFGPLTAEIDRAAKETMAGKPFTEALMSMTSRSSSSVLSKTMRLIVEGVNSGGNLGELLENTAKDIRKFSIMRKEINATVMVYQLFMMAAAAIGAPLIYGVASFLVKVISSTQSRIGTSLGTESSKLPFFSNGGAVGLSPETVFWFAVAAIVLTSFFSALAVGVIAKGKESEGLPYFPILLGASLGVFMVVRFLLEAFGSGLMPL